MFAAQSSGASTYWAAVVTAVPVLGLAMVIEARRTASRWTLKDHALVRLLLSLAFLYQGATLVFIMARGLQALASGRSTDSASAVNSNLIGVTALVLVTPVLDAFLRTNPDVMLFLVRVPPWSKWSRNRRRLKRNAKRTLRDFPAVEAQHRGAVRRLEETLGTFKTRQAEALAHRGEAEEKLRSARATVASLPEQFREPVEETVRTGEARLSASGEHFATAADHFQRASDQVETAREHLATATLRRDALEKALRRWHAWSIDEEDRKKLEAALTTAQRELRGQPS